MWRLRPHQAGREQGPLEGKTVEVGKLKLHVNKTIAQGGFSFVYLTKCAQSGKLYALKHVRCNDEEGAELMKKEVGVMLGLRGHPNVVTLHAHSKVEAGAWTEFFLAMDYCEKTLVNVIDSRGQTFYDEKQLLLVFRDVCTGVYIMHSRSPPVAHRDLKAENVLLGGDGHWKLCDFGSVSTTHRRFERAEEMGPEEDIIRKHTTPAYRAPEMWDLYSRDLINEKVDIWALGCLLYKLAYFKPCFDGDSKLQILNGNYRIPEAPQYSSKLIELIRRMLTTNPEKRPDIAQVLSDVNNLLPGNARKPLPEKLPRANEAARDSGTEPQQAAPLKPSEPRTAADQSSPVRTARKAPPTSTPPSPPLTGSGSFWSMDYAKQPRAEKSRGSISASPQKQPTLERTLSGGPLDGSELQQGRTSSGSLPGPNSQIRTASQMSGADDVQKAALREDVAPDFVSGGRVDSDYNRGTVTRSLSEDTLVEMMGQCASLYSPSEEDSSAQGGGSESGLKEQVKKLREEKADLVAKCEKLAGMVRKQRREIQELRTALAAGNDDSAAEPGSPLIDLERAGAGAASPSDADRIRSRSPSVRSPETTGEKPSSVVHPAGTPPSITLAKQQSFAFASPAASGSSGARPSNGKQPLTEAASLGAWRAFDEPEVETPKMPAANSSRVAAGQQGVGGSQQVDWAAFESMAPSGSSTSNNANGAPHASASGSAFGASPQWEAPYGKDGKGKSGSRSSQPAGWAGF